VDDDDEEEIKRIEEDIERRRLEKKIEDYLRKIEKISMKKKIIYYLNMDIPNTKEGKYIYIFLLNKNEVFVCVCIEKILVPTYIYRQAIEELPVKEDQILYNIFMVVFYLIIVAASIYFAISNMNLFGITSRNTVQFHDIEYLYCKDCNSIDMQSLTFNSWIHALNIKRINVTKPHAMDVTITQCKFNNKNVPTSREILRMYNIITVDKSNFTHAYFNISLGASQTSVSSNPNIKDINFGSSENKYRTITSLNSNIFKNLNANDTIVIQLVANNKNNISSARMY
ncbi:hypothetical protein RFI_29659, partial [Reticulomyxa filosa]